MLVPGIETLGIALALVLFSRYSTYLGERPDKFQRWHQRMKSWPKTLWVPRTRDVARAIPFRGNIRRMYGAVI